MTDKNNTFLLEYQFQGADFQSVISTPFKAHRLYLVHLKKVIKRSKLLSIGLNLVYSCLHL